MQEFQVLSNYLNRRVLVQAEWHPLKQKINITDGFTTNLLFRQPRKVAILVSSSKFDNSYVSLASRRDVRKFAFFTFLDSDKEIITAEIMKQFDLPEQENRNCSCSIRAMVSSRSASLRFLQKAKVDAVFGYQNTLTLSDESLFQEIVTHVDTPAMPSTGGCSFMSGGAGGGAIHEE